MSGVNSELSCLARLFQQLGNDSSRLLEYGVVRPFALFSERDFMVGDTLFETLVSILVT